MNINIKSKIFDVNKYALYKVNKDFKLDTSKGEYTMEKDDILGIRRATSNKNKVRIIEKSNPNVVVSIDIKDLSKLSKYLKYQSNSKQDNIFEEI